MGKPESKTTEPKSEISSEQLEALRKELVDLSAQRNRELEAIFEVCHGGEIDPQFEFPTLKEVRELRRGRDNATLQSMDYLEKLEAIKKAPQVPMTSESRLSSKPNAIILPDGMRINLGCLAAYHPTGDGDIEFKTSDGKQLAFWHAPDNGPQGSMDPKKRREVRDRVIETLDELFGAVGD